ncbi:MAG: hypothetical protein ACLPKI_31990 [Streptosporangiaceae bacterium]
MKEYGLTLLVAAAVTYLLTPLARRFAILIGAQHEARERDVHTAPTPRLGGLAMYCGLAAGLLVASRMFPLSGVFQNTRVGSGLLLAGGVVVLMGLVDDRWGLGALTKLAGQVVAGAILVWSGAVIDWLPLPGGNTLGLTSDEGTVLTILVVVVTINAVNFIDGLDGLATGIVGIGAAAFYLYYYTLAKRLGLSELADPALASAVLAGVCVGFLPYNFHPARIFMGDTGSMLLGLLLAYAPISSLASIDPQSLVGPSAYSGGTVNRFPEILPLLVPATIMLIPYVDLLLAVFRRTRAGLSPFAADKKHLQHRLLDIGHSHRASVLIMYLWAILFAGTVVLLSIMQTKLPVLAIVTAGGFLSLLMLSMPRLRPWRRGPSRRAPAGAARAGPAAAVPAAVPATPLPGPAAPLPGPAAPLPGPAAPVPGPAVPAAYDQRASYDRPAGYDPQAGYDRPAGYDPQAGYDRQAGYGRPAGYDPQAGYGRPAGYDRPAGHRAPAAYGPDDPRTAAAAGLAGLSGPVGRSAGGLASSGPADPEPASDRGPGRPDPGRYYSGGNGRPPGGRGYPGGNGSGNGAGHGHQAAGPADPGYGGGYPAAPAGRDPAGRDPAGHGPGDNGRGDGGRGDDGLAGGGAGAGHGPGPEDAEQPPRPGRPAWPGDYPEAQEPLLPWRFS